jgi:hypothetical protein
MLMTALETHRGGKLYASDVAAHTLQPFRKLRHIVSINVNCVAVKLALLVL